MVRLLNNSEVETLLKVEECLPVLEQASRSLRRQGRQPAENPYLHAHSQRGNLPLIQDH